MQTHQPIKDPLVTCPACGLLCDDIVVGDVVKNACTKRVKFFAQSLPQSTPSIAGRPVTMPQAVVRIAELIRSAKQPLIAGLSTDLAGFRAAYQLAEKTNTTLAHMNATAIWRNVKVLQSTGWQTTTLTEVKNRADVIVCVGTDVVTHNPRFFERIVWAKDAMFVEAQARDIIYLGGEGLEITAGVSPQGKLPKVLPCAPAQLPEVTATLHALVAGKALKAKAVAGIAVADLLAVAEKLKQAQYAVLIWIAKDLDFPHAELTIQQITQTVVVLNETTRAGALTLGGSDGDTTVNYAHTWLSGLAIHEQALPAHDALIWVNSFSPDKPTPNTGAPTIVLGSASMVLDNAPDVFIPIATPGLDCAGTLFRVDSSVVMPLKKVRDTDMPTLAQVLAMVEEALA